MQVVAGSWVTVDLGEARRRYRPGTLTVEPRFVDLVDPNAHLQLEAVRGILEREPGELLDELDPIDQGVPIQVQRPRGGADVGGLVEEDLQCVDQLPPACPVIFDERLQGSQNRRHALWMLP
jgi:hypothetical protein